MDKVAKSNNEATSRSAKRKQKQQKKSNKMSLGKKILLSILGFILAVGVGGLAFFGYYALNAPELTQKDLTGTYASDLVDMNGEVFYSLGAEEREYAEADEYPQVMLDAIRAIEDTRFDSHVGIDPIGITRAAVGYLTNAGSIVGGGSTITQQLIKLSVFSTEKVDQTLERKAQEAWLAIQLERQLSKEQIMTLYLNRINMGGNVYGVSTAAKEYYGKHVSELELHEAAMFAAMPKAPNHYNPYLDPVAAKNRRDLVLNEMVEFGAITQEEADVAKEIPVEQGLLDPVESGNNLVFDAYLTTVIEEVREKTEYDPYTAGLTIHTNYDPNAQKLLYDVVNSDEYVDFPDDELQTAITLVDSTSGKVTALIGGRNLEGQLSMNRATQDTRSVASTIKPLTVYGPAIEFEQFSTYHQVVDEPYSFGDWTPGNYDDSFRGQMSMREALVDSRNIPAAKIFNEDLNQVEVERFLKGIGINAANLSQDGLVRSSSLDGTISPLDLAGAYAAFANEGNYTTPYTVTKIVDQRGDETDLVPPTNKAMEDYTAYMITDMLKGVVASYDRELNIPGYIHAAKTGTTNYTAEQMAEHNIPSTGVPDSWLVGYSPYYTMSVWVGYDEQFKEGNYLTFNDGSRRLARYIYRAAMSQLVTDFETRDWERPNSVEQLSVVRGSSPAIIAPAGSANTVRELFVKGSSERPTQTAQPTVEPEEPKISEPSGLTANYSAETDSVRISWNAFKLPQGLSGDIQYLLSINGQEELIAGTDYVINKPTVNVYNISLAVRVNTETGPRSSIQFTIQEVSDTEETDEEEVDDSEEEEKPEEEPEEPVEEPEAPEEPDEEEKPTEEEEEDESEEEDS